MDEKIIISLSGGMDSAVVLALACEKFGRENVQAIGIDYDQSHVRENAAAQSIAAHFGIKRFEVKCLDFSEFSSGSILNPTEEMDDSFSHAPEGSQIAPSWVPARNALLLSAIAGYAYIHHANTIGTGVNAVDWSGYPDCTPAFIGALQEALRFGLDKQEFTIYAPLIQLSKKDIVLEGERLLVPWSLTWSCYEGSTDPCGVCGACKVRKIGFDAAGVNDPLEVR